MKLTEIQAALREEGLDGWLFFDHHRRDPLAYRVLQFTPGSMVTRRWFYYIPANGEPRGLVHKIEAQTLAPLPGRHSLYAGWSTLVDGLEAIIGGGAAWPCSIRRTAQCRMWQWWMPGPSSWCAG